MAENKMKMLRSVLRTILAVVCLVVGIGAVILGVSWTSWCPENDFGVILLLLLYSMGLVFILYGIYQISPILSTRIMPDVLQKFFDIPTDWIEYQEKIEKLHKRYIW